MTHIANQVSQAVMRELSAVHSAMQQALITGDMAELARLRALYAALLAQAGGR